MEFFLIFSILVVIVMYEWGMILKANEKKKEKVEESWDDNKQHTEQDIK